ncbi:MAG: CBS domain-containing protein [Gammaproteobacteria bacterium]|nr:CBS domain-containing protein [Gammaproteobacteria bacterium]
MKTVHEVLAHKDNRLRRVHPDDTVYDAIRMMADHEVGALLVMVDDELKGIISERDYARKVILKDKGSKHTSVAEIMTQEVVAATSHDKVGDCVTKMKDHHFRHLPVIDDGVVIGMLSLRDLFSTIIEDQASTIDQMEHYIRGEV